MRYGLCSWYTLGHLYNRREGPAKTTILRHCQTLQERARDDASGPAKAFRNAQEMQKQI